MTFKSLLLDWCRRLIDNQRYHGREILWAVSAIAACPVFGRDVQLFENVGGVD